MEEKVPVAGLHVDFLQSEEYSQLNGKFGKDGLQVMLAGKHYQCTYVVVLFISGYIDRVTGHEKEKRLTMICTFYSELFVDLCSEKRMSGINDEWIGSRKKVTRVEEEDCHVA